MAAIRSARGTGLKRQSPAAPARQLISRTPGGEPAALAAGQAGVPARRP
jgi:hypothetical protein